MERIVADPDPPNFGAHQTKGEAACRLLRSGYPEYFDTANRPAGRKARTSRADSNGREGASWLSDCGSDEASAPQCRIDLALGCRAASLTSGIEACQCRDN